MINLSVDQLSSLHADTDRQCRVISGTKSGWSADYGGEWGTRVDAVIVATQVFFQCPSDSVQLVHKICLCTIRVIFWDLLKIHAVASITCLKVVNVNI